MDVVLERAGDAGEEHGVDALLLHPLLPPLDPLLLLLSLQLPRDMEITMEMVMVDLEMVRTDMATGTPMEME